MSCNSLLVVPQLLSQLERNAILVHFDSLTWSSLKSTNHFDVALPDRPVMFVKYGNRAILAEASTQSLFHALAQGDSMAPRIPRVYDAFHGTRCCFLVMEKVDQPTLAECTLSDAEAIERAAFAVRWLIRQIQHIPVSVFGRIAADHKAHARHRFFKDHDAPLAFANATALTKFVNKALSRCLPARRPDPIAFSDARFIYHSDVSKHNFLLDPETSELWLIDFEHVGVFPEPFQQYGFFNIGSPFASAVGRALDIHPSDVANAMARAAGVLVMSAGDERLGLDEFGEVRAIVKRRREPSSHHNSSLRSPSTFTTVVVGM